MKYIITMPEPCHEKWHLMTATEKGRFCDSCEKEVIDFTATSTSGLAKKLDKGEEICGRFRKDQLNKEFSSHKSHSLQRTGLAFGLTSLLALCTPAEAQEKIEKVETIQTITLGAPAIIRENPPAPNKPQIIKGVVLDQDDLPLPGATIVIEGTTIGTQTDFDGNFQLEIPTHKKSEIKNVKISYIGFIDEIIPLKDFKENIALTMKIDSYVLGGMVGGIVVVKRKSIFRKIADFFNKKHNTNETQETNVEVLEIEETELKAEFETSIEKQKSSSTVVWPNPISDVVNIKYNMQENGSLKVSLQALNQPFQKALTLKKVEHAKGEYTNQFSIKNVTNGIYVLHIEANGTIETHKVIVDKK